MNRDITLTQFIAIETYCEIRKAVFIESYNKNSDEVKFKKIKNGLKVLRLWNITYLGRRKIPPSSSKSQ